MSYPGLSSAVQRDLPLAPGTITPYPEPLICLVLGSEKEHFVTVFSTKCNDARIVLPRCGPLLSGCFCVLTT